MGLQVLAIDDGEDKRKLSKELGAEVFIDFKKSRVGGFRIQFP